MAKNTNKNKTTNPLKLPSVNIEVQNSKITLPYNGNAVAEKGFSFSFACFDRSQELFNLGDKPPENVVSGNWFIDLMDCLKNVSNMTVPELRTSMYDLHPVDWSGANAKMPKGSEQCEYWQFRISKSKGRVIGILLPGIFYIVWLDPHHNLTDSEGYGTVKKYSAGLSIYEQRESYIEELQKKIAHLEEELKTAEVLLDEK